MQLSFIKYVFPISNSFNAHETKTKQMGVGKSWKQSDTAKCLKKAGNQWRERLRVYRELE